MRPGWYLFVPLPFIVIYCVPHYTLDGQRNSELVPSSTVWAPGLALCHQAQLHTPTHLHLALPVHSEVSEELTSILHVMIPGSLLTALKAPLRDIVSVFLELKYHKARGDREEPDASQR